MPARRIRPRGFSLVEMLIVVAVILVIAAIAVPNLLRARARASESAAVASMRTINTAESMYYNAYPQVGYAGSLAELGSGGSSCESTSQSNACIIMDNTLTSGLKSGYTFDLASDGQIPSQGYMLTASPQSGPASGRCSFFSDQTGAISAGTSGGPRLPLDGHNCEQPVSTATFR
ncbi:MAG TPA: prepilin-type N-terminal cleavage/methylation domain-containing protein [Candidatus Angelobacter sp.]|nr:prepilin-type N-terminal cleavage/methylation domain-containing protein [Candidatus Angelobacter sp.]